jgi:hypothetical protein
LLVERFHGGLDAPELLGHVVGQIAVGIAVVDRAVPAFELLQSLLLLLGQRHQSLRDGQPTLPVSREDGAIAELRPHVCFGGAERKTFARFEVFRF